MNAVDQIYGLANVIARQAFQIEQLEQQVAEVTKERDELKDRLESPLEVPSGNGGTDETQRLKIAEEFAEKGG